MTRRDPTTDLPHRARAFSRRELLMLLGRGAGAAALAPSVLDLITRHALAQASAPTAVRKKLILLWLEGGPSQIDTFDPKPGSPTNGPFKSIPTGVAGWSMSEHLSGLAQRAERLAVIRSMTSKEGSHARARELLHCGYVPTASVAYPTIGSVVAHEIGDLDFDLPAFVQIGGPTGSSGYLGIESAPFVISDANGKINNLGYRPEVDGTRLDSRDRIRAMLDDEFARHGGGDTVASINVQRRRARRLMDTKLLPAFDLSLEPDPTRDAYGRSSFGQGVLLARRLIESGVSAVEVVLGGWDTHVDNFTRLQALCAQLDPAFSSLIDDLSARGHLDDTLVLCMGEFGRTPTINSGVGRHHWPSNYCVVLAGGGSRAGTVVGETDERGETIVRRPVRVADLFATIARLLGIEAGKEFNTATRPVKLVDPNGAVVTELLP